MATYDSHDPGGARHRLISDEPLAPAAPRVPGPRPDAAAACGHLVADQLRRPTAELRWLIPEVFAGFSGLHDAALGAGAVDALTKEMVALALAVSKQCDGCIAAHARSVARLGATEQQVAEIIGVTILMDGGPATVYGPRALAAFREFATAAAHGVG